MANLNSTIVNGTLHVNGSRAVTVKDMKSWFGADRPELTVLYSDRAGSGTIKLNDNWQNYDMLVFIITDDNGNGAQMEYHPTWLIKEAISVLTSTGKNDICLSPGPRYWFITKESTADSLVAGSLSENAIMERIYGVNFT